MTGRRHGRRRPEEEGFEGTPIEQGREQDEQRLGALPEPPVRGNRPDRVKNLRLQDAREEVAGRLERTDRDPPSEVEETRPAGERRADATIAVVEEPRGRHPDPRGGYPSEGDKRRRMVNPTAKRRPFTRAVRRVPQGHRQGPFFRTVLESRNNVYVAVSNGWAWYNDDGHGPGRCGSRNRAPRAAFVGAFFVSVASPLGRCRSAVISDEPTLDKRMPRRRGKGPVGGGSLLPSCSRTGPMREDRDERGT